jgi:CubicO group peptidase (beta-lactamase class C family)
LYPLEAPGRSLPLRNAGTLFWIDPKEQFIAIHMVQVNNGDRIMLANQFRTMVRSAIIN